MKKIIKLSMIGAAALVAIFMFPSSCKKKSTSSVCQCKYKPIGSTSDTTFNITLPAGYSASLSTYCASYDATIKSAYGSTAGCSMK